MMSKIQGDISLYLPFPAKCYFQATMYGNMSFRLLPVFAKGMS